MKTIIFLGTSLVGAQYLAEAVQPLGLRPVFLLKLGDYGSEPKQAISLCEHYEADVNSLADLERAIDEHNLTKNAVAITSLLDETLHHACELARKYHLIGPDQALQNLVDKSYVQDLIPEYCPPCLKFSFATTTDDDLQNFFKQHAAQAFLLKPGVSSGAVGITAIDDSATVATIKDLITHANIVESTQQQWLIQPRLSGRLYSLEGYVKNTQPTFLGFSKRTRIALSEVACEFPVDAELSVVAREHCQEIIKTLVMRANYGNGYFHCEFIIDDAGVYLIDSNMGRPIGGPVVQQLALYYQKQPAAIYNHVFDLGLFAAKHSQDFHYSAACSPRATFSILYALPMAAVVQNVVIPTTLRAQHTLLASADKSLPAVGTNDGVWVGFLAGWKDDVVQEIERIVINTDHGPVKPCYALDECIPISPNKASLARG